MSRARFKRGGSVEIGGKARSIASPAVTKAYAGGDSTVAKDAKERKAGGRVGKCEDDGKKAKMHLGRPGRKSGGRIGANKMPLSTAAKISSANEH